jgi:hypothetical protein
MAANDFTDPEEQDSDTFEAPYAEEFQRVNALQKVLAERPFRDDEIDELIRLSRFEAFPAIQVRALTALWYVTDLRWSDQILHSMRAGLKSPMPSVRAYAASGLARQGAAETVPEILICLRSVTNTAEEKSLRNALKKLGYRLPPKSDETKTPSP